MAGTHVTLAAWCAAQAQSDPHAVRRGRRPECKLTHAVPVMIQAHSKPSPRGISPPSSVSHTEQRPFLLARRRRLRLLLLSYFSHRAVLGSGWQVTTSRGSSGGVGKRALLCVTVR